MNKDSRIYIAGHTGLVGKTLVKELQSRGYTNLITPSRLHYDLLSQRSVYDLFDDHAPEYMFICAAKVGGIQANINSPYDFLYENLVIQNNLIQTAITFGVNKVVNLGSSCFIPNTPVYTDKGIKYIEDIKIDDMVLSHDGTYNKVISLYNKRIHDNILSITIKNWGIIKCTDDHMIYTKEHGFISASKLSIGDTLIAPVNNLNIIENMSIIPLTSINKTTHDAYHYYIKTKCSYGELSRFNIPRSTYDSWRNNKKPRFDVFKHDIITPDLAYILGVYLAEGYSSYRPSNARGSQYSVSFSPGFNPTFLNKIEVALNNSFSVNVCKFSKRTSEILYINNKYIAELFQLFYGADSHKAHDKIIPEFIYNLPVNLKIEFLRGYFDGDGTRHVRNRSNYQLVYCASSTSHKLILGIQRLLLDIGVDGGVYFIKKRPTCIIENRLANQRNQWSVRLYGDHAIKLDALFNNIPTQQDTHEFKVKAITPVVYDGLVYDMTVENTHTYTANGIAVHNCIYPKDYTQPLKEEYLLNAPLEPTNEGYALAKICGLKLCEYANKQLGTNFISLMPCNLYGPGDHYDLKNSHVLSALIMKIVEAKESNNTAVEIWGSGTQRREFLYINDLIDGMIWAMTTLDKTDTFINIGYGTDISILELANLIARIVDFRGEFVCDTSKPDGMKQKLLDVTKINNLGWKAPTSLEEGVKKSVEDYYNFRKSN